MTNIRPSTIICLFFFVSCIFLVRGIFQYQLPYTKWYLAYKSETASHKVAYHVSPLFSPPDQIGKDETSSVNASFHLIAAPPTEPIINITGMRKSSIPTTNKLNRSASENGLASDQTQSHSTTAIAPSSRTKIVAFSEFKYQEIALKWYRRMDYVGYIEHLLVATDDQAAAFFEKHKLRYDLLFSQNTSFKFSDCDSHLKLGKRRQNYRRHIFSSRWNYIWRLLKNGTNVLVSDVDTVFNRYVPLQSLEDTNVDHFIGYEGGVPSFPKIIFNKKGFTVNGGMHWLRASSGGLLEFVRALVEQCGCLELSCRCLCDDQVVLNNIIFFSKYIISWDDNGDSLYGNNTNASRAIRTIPRNWSEVSWEGKTGVCNKTGHRVQIWDRHTAFRGPLGDSVPCPKANWFSMPQGVEKEKVHEIWDNTCGQNSTRIF